MTRAVLHVCERGRGLTRYAVGMPSVRDAVKQAQVLRKQGAKVRVEIVSSPNPEMPKAG